MKKVLSVILALSCLAALLGSFPCVFASDDESSPIPEGLKYYIRDNAVTISEYSGDATELVIPDMIEGYPVKHISTSAFGGNYNLRSIKLPSTMTELDSHVLNWCIMLEEVFIPTSITKIESFNFADYRYANRIYYAGDRFSWHRITIDEYNEGLDKVSVYYNSSFVSEDRKYSYEYTSSGGVNIGGYIGKDDEVVVPETIDGYPVENILEYSFSECLGIKELIIPENIVYIGDYAFSGCTNLKSLVIPETVENIGGYAFSDCTNLKSLVVPETVKNIYSSAFSNCRNLREIEISAKTDIGSFVFSDCNNLSLVKYRGTKEEWEKLCISNTYLRNCPVILNYGTPIAGFMFELDETAKTVTITGYEGVDTEIVIPESYGDYTVTYVSPTAFAGNTVITGVSVPKTVESIEERSFEGCTALKRMTFAEGVDIGNYAFEGCISLENVTFAEGTVDIGTVGIGNYAFAGCTALKDVTLAEGTVDIGDYAFAGCTALESIILPEGTESVWRNAFEGCSSLKTVKLPSTIEVIDYKAFYDCDSLKYVIYDGSAEEFEAVEVVSGNKPLLSASFTYLADMESNVIPGDIDGDNVLTVKDINLIKRIISNLLEAAPGSDTYFAADFDSNGIVNAMDSNALKRAFVGFNS